jgi:thiol-disulfide isomerase/thioredoxin
MKISAKIKTIMPKMFQTIIFMSLFFVYLISNVTCNTKKNTIVIDERSKNEVLIGLCNKSAFQYEIFKDWYNEGYNNYNPDEKTLNELKKIIKSENIKITIVFGTWCSDSRREIPRFYKIIDKMEFLESDIKLIGVDTKKSSRNNLLKDIEFERIPTFIFFKNGKETGRIVEVPVTSIEQDMLNCLK